ncbi:ABC transporter substrate-binding protein [Marimonas arenosa]|uniref:ABC transporter substrate-binding protein n=1 Tax=Marimonas arenosa TaxID=1795305 RepID=A0AAE4B6A4_9RHOB|nr:ABC transporter substrate-binding protein [Marimonas arenosa]MDQ2090156.1 ABC transporter substrate-binding protein [Marimonas arenosa]
MKRRIFLAATAMALSLAVTGPQPAVAETPPNMLVIANRIDDITTLDPAESFEFAGSDVSRNVYGKLVNFDPMNLDGGYIPDLAESWTVSEDGRTITFKMRPDVKFHSGNPVTAMDAEYSLRRAVILNKTPSFILTQFGFTADNVGETIVAPDDMTLSITTDKRYATSFVLNCLTATIGGIVDSKLVMENEQDGDMGNTWLKTNTAGSGAYKVASWKPNESVTLVSNPDFYLGAPAMERVIVRHVQESASQRLLLERGDVDLARNLNPEDVKGITGKEGIEVDSELRGRLMYVSVNQKHPELSKPEVKTAIKYLIDYKGMQDSFLNGQYTIHQNFLPRTFLGAIDDAPYSLNVEKAKELLAAAGVSDLKITAGVREAQERLEIAQSLQNTLAQAGITLELTVGTGKQILSKYRARELDMYIGAWGPDYPDPHTNAGTFAYNPDNSDEAGATGLLAWRNAWDTGGLTEKVAAAVVENDRDARKAMYEEIQREFLETSPFAVMFQKIEQTGRNAKVQNLNLGGATTAVSYWPVTK